jgi:hypothetical protein
MDPAIKLYMEEDLPPFNEKIVNGFATYEIPKVVKWVKTLFESIQETFPKGMKFKGITRCTPYQEYNEATRRHNQRTIKGSQRSTFDIAESYVYMVGIENEYKGQKLKTRYLSLPYVTDGGFIKISDSLYTITPILIDRVISVMRRAIFVRLIKTRFNVHRLLQHFVLDREEVHAHVVWSKIHQKDVARDHTDTDIVAAESTLAHYLFCKYGVIEAFKQFANCDVIVGTDDTITPEKYPESDWIIARTRRDVATGPVPLRKRDSSYQATRIRLAFPRQQLTPMVHNLIGGFYYVADHFPDKVRFLPEYTTRQTSSKLEDEKRLWWLILGHLVSPTSGVGQVINEMAGHIRSLDEYIDPIVRKQLSDIGFQVNNVYQLFAILIEQFDPMLLEGKKHLSSMWNKEMNINLVLFEISKPIVELGFSMLKLAEEENLTADKINAKIAAHIKTGAVYRIYKSSGAVSANSYPGDNKVFKITTMLVPQQHANKSKRKKANLQLRDPINQAHSSLLGVGGPFALKKSHPSGHFVSNPHGLMDDNNVVYPNPKFKDRYEEVQRELEK